MAKATNPTPNRPRPRPHVAAVALAASLALTGCETTAGKKVLGLISPRYDESLSKGLLRPEDSNPNRFLSRYLTPSRTPHASGSKEPDSLTIGPDGYRPVRETPDPAADKALEEATALYRQGKYEEARPKLAKLAKDHKGQSWGMKAQFLLGECYFEQAQYVWAQEAFEQFLKDYHGEPEYIDKAVAREYAIAEKWLAYAPDPKAKPGAQFAFTDRFRARVPLLDAEGYAVRALEKVRENDVTGPLADDACIRLADFYMQKKDYETAAMYYDQLPVDYPKSEHVRRAHLASIDAKLKGYMGPEYDGKPLESALDTIRQVQVSFPEEKDKLYKTIDLIYDQHAERAYRVGLYYLDYYKRTGYGAAAAEYYFGLVNARWPKTEWAKKSKDELALLAKAPRKEAQTSRIMTMPGSIAPFSGSGGGGGGGGMGGMGGGGMGGMGGMGGGMGGMGGMGMPG